MKYIEKHPMIMILVGILGISLSAIFVKYADAPSAVTAAYRLLWTSVFLTPVVFGRKAPRQELLGMPVKGILLSTLSGAFLAVHFVTWFESLKHTSVASSTTIVCTEVVWVALGFCLLLKGTLSRRAIGAIAVTLGGSVLIAWSDSGTGAQVYGDLLVLVAVCVAQGYGLAAFGWSPVVVGLLLALFSTILGHSIFSWCLKYFSPAFVSASKLCEPVVAAAFAGFLFGELPRAGQILGGCLILGGVLYYSHIEKTEKA